MEKTQPFYDRYGKEWAEPLRQAFEESCSIEKVRNYQSIIPDHLEVNSLVDFGCGHGTALQNLGEALRIPTRIGIDISYSMVAVARERFPEYLFIQGGLECLDSLEILPPGLLMFNDVLEHLPDPKSYLKKAVARFDYIAVQVPVEKTWLVALMNRLHLKEPRSRVCETEGHLHEFSTREVQILLTESGLEVSQWGLFKPSQEIMFHPYLLDRMKQKSGLVNKLKSFMYCCFCYLPYKPVRALLTQKTGATFVGFCEIRRR